MEGEGKERGGRGDPSPSRPPPIHISEYAPEVALVTSI